MNVNIGYILILAHEYYEGSCKGKVFIADVERAAASSYEMRNKFSLIEQSSTAWTTLNGVEEDWRVYIAKKREAKLAVIIEGKSSTAGSPRTCGACLRTFLLILS